MRKPHKKITIIVIAFICILFAASFFYVSRSNEFMKFAAKTVSDTLTETLDTKVDIDSLTIESLSSIRANKITVYDKTGAEFLQSDNAAVNFSLWSIVTGNTAASIRSVIVNKPTVNIIKRDNGTWNYEDVFSQKQTNNNFKGNIRINDGIVNAEISNKKISLSEVNGDVDLSDSSKTMIDIQAQQNGTAVAVNGSISSESKNINIKADKFDVSPYLDLIPADKLPQNLEIKGGILKDVDMTLNIDQDGSISAKGRTRLADGACHILNTDVDNINGLIIFDKDYITIFGNVSVKQQIVSLHGKITLEDDPRLSLLVRSDAINPKNIFTDIPFDGNVAFSANVSGTVSNPAVSADLSAAQADCYGYHFTNAKAQGDFENNTLYIKSASCDFADGKISASGVFSSEDDSYNGHAVLQNIQCAKLDEYVPGLSGKLSADVVFQGNINDLSNTELSASAELTDAYYNGIPIHKANISFSKQGQNIKVDAMAASLGDSGNISASGNINGSNIDFEFYGSNIDLSLFQGYIPVSVSGTAGFYGHLQGDMDDPYLQLEAGASDGQIMNQPYHALRVSAVGNMDGVVIKKMTVQNESNEVIHSIQGIVGFKGDHNVDLVINTKDARMENIAAVLLPGQPITGNIDNNLHLTGTLDNIKASGHILFHEGSYYGILLTAAEGDYTYDAGNTSLNNFVIKSPFADVKISGSVRNNNVLDFDIDADNVNFSKMPLHLPYPVEGNGSFKGHVGGTFDNPAFNSTFNAGQITFNGKKITNVTGQCDYKNDMLSITNMQCQQDTGKIALSGYMNFITEQVQGNVQADNISVQSLLAMANLQNKYSADLTGTFNGSISLSGDYRNPNAHLTGEIKDGHLKKYPLQEISIDASYENGIISINKFYGQQNEGKIAAQGTWDINGPINMELSTQNIGTDLLTELIDYNIDAKGTANAYAKISGTSDKPQADISFEIDGGGIGTATFDRMTGLLNLNNGVIDVKQILVNKGEYKASASGKVPLAALKAKPWEMLTRYDQIDLNIYLDHADLSILPSLSKYVEYASGPLQGNLKINGTLAHPLFFGSMQMHDGTMKIKGMKTPLQKMQADITFNSDQMKVNDFSGHLGTGTYSLQGSTLITGGGLRNYNFALNVDKAYLESDFYRGPLSAQFTLKEGTIFNRVMPELAGNLTIQDSTISFPAIPDSDNSILPDMLLDVGINVGKNVHFYKSMLYNMDISGNIHYGGTTKHPKPSGEINVLKGTVEYLQTVFKIREGTAYFNQVDSFLPSITFKADTTLSQTKVYLSIQGPVGNMQFLLVSNPAMSQEEIIKLLTFRSAYKQGESTGTADLAQLATIGLQMSFLNEIEGFVRDTLKIDEFNIVRDTVYNSDDRGQQSNYDDVYDVEIGKYISNKIMLKYTNSINYDDHKYGIQYDLSNNVSILNEWDSKNGYKITIEANKKF